LNIIEVVHENDWTKVIVDVKVIVTNNVVKSQTNSLKANPSLVVPLGTSHLHFIGPFKLKKITGNTR
jgi:hypothetical protein